MTLRAAVFASGRGSNFQVLTEYASGGSPGVSQRGDPSAWEVVLLLTDQKEAPALERADALGVEWKVIAAGHEPAEAAEHMLHALREAAIDMILLAGYLRLVPGEVVSEYSGRMLNLHPALLPSFGGKGMYGRRVHEAVLEAGVRLSGATVHLVDEEYDRGRILAQWPVPVILGDTPEALAKRVTDVEHRLYPAAADNLARAIAEGSEIVPIPGPKVHFDFASHLPIQQGTDPESGP